MIIINDESVMKILVTIREIFEVLNVNNVNGVVSGEGIRPI